MKYESFKIDEREFKRKFEKSFSSFCEKSPLILSFKIAGDKVIINDRSGLMEDNYLHQLEYLKDVKVNIAEIKEHLQKYYPVFFDEIEKKPTQEEIQEMVDRGIDYKTIMSKPGEFKSVPRYQIIRVINQCNEINVFDYQERKVKFFKLSVPVVSFMEEVYHNAQSAYTTFKNNSRIVEYEG
jgi:hypothetical protein